MSVSPTLCLSAEDGMFSVSLAGQSLPLKAKIYADGHVGLRQLGVQADSDDGFLPLGLLRISRLSDGYLLPFVSLGEKRQLQLWRLDPQFNFIAQVTTSMEELALLWHLNILPEDPGLWDQTLPAECRALLQQIKQQLQALAPAVSTGFSDGLLDQGHQRSSKALALAMDSLPKRSFAQLTENFLQCVETWDGQGGDGRGTVSAARFKQIWQDTCERGTWSKEPQLFPTQCRYEYLRELAAIFYGCDVVYNPLSGQHQFCQASRFFAIPHSRGCIAKFCISFHKDVPLVEFRGSGWSACSMAYQIGAFFMWQSVWRGSSSWEANFDGLVEQRAERFLASLDPVETPPDKALVVNSSDQANLGHFLWNDLSGLYLAAESPDLSPQVDLAVYNPFRPGFGGTESYFDLAARVGLFPETTSVSYKDADQAFIFSHPRPVILKSLIFSPTLAGRIRDYASTSASPEVVQEYVAPDAVNILVNIRAHNKCWENISECFAEFLSNLPTGLEASNLCFVLEYGEGGDKVADRLAEQCDAHNIQTRRAVNLNLEKLLYVTDRVALVISPVGSGLVLPTWVWGKPVITHGDPGHMNQLQWWARVSETSHGYEASNPRAIALSDITPARDKFYSDYSITPRAFSELMNQQLALVVPAA